MKRINGFQDFVNEAKKAKDEDDEKDVKVKEESDEKEEKEEEEEESDKKPKKEKEEKESDKEEKKETSEKKGFKSNIEKDTKKNDDFRKVLYTGEHLQLVLMILKPGEEIGMEEHKTIDQFFRFEEGKGKVIINETEYTVGNGDVVIIPAKSMHNIINTSKDEALKMYTIYTPPNHKDGVTFETKAEAEKSKEKYDGKPTEE